MKRLPLYLLMIVGCMILVSCEKSVFKGFDKTKNGAYMKFHSVNKDGDMPQMGDVVIINLKQWMGDTLFYSSEFEEDGVVDFELTEPDFVGDMMAGLFNMHVGDSVTVAYLIDSMCIKTLGMDAVPDYLIPGTPLYLDMKLVSIIKAEEVAAQRKIELERLKQQDEDHLAMYYSDEKNKITKDGLIILSVKGKGRGANDGDILMINFNLLSLDGDTLLDLYHREPVAIQCGDDYLGTGFAEALHYLPEGGEGHFVIPSSLAYDSVGLEYIILPYTSLLLNVNSSRYYTLQEYEDYQRELAEAEEAENLQRLKDEPARIAKFVREHNVKVEPSETGVYYLEIAKGTGDVADNGDIVSIHYNLYNIDDKLIETSYGDAPMRFVYGVGEMVPGIEEALGNMRVGGKATIIVPSPMGFGDVAIDKELPANSTVIFDLELIDVQKIR